MSDRAGTRSGHPSQAGSAVTASGDEAELRSRIGRAKRVVIKIGSAALTTLEGGIRRDALDRLADAAQARMAAGSDVFVVSSGAIGAGMSPLGMTKRPSAIAAKQAAASVGQLELARAWGESFQRFDRVVGQVLLTAADIGRRDSAANAQQTLDRLRALGAVPIINENDTVATTEIQFGDNDRLAALVAHLIGADALFLLSDVDSLYDSDPRLTDARRISYVGGDGDLDGVVAGAGGALGSGGMASKVSSARLAADAGVPVLLAAASRAEAALAGFPESGTAFEARGERMSARRFWVRHAAGTHGVLVLDDGAVRAVSGRDRRSLLVAGVTGVEGEFHFGDVVDLRDTGGRLIARGVAQYAASEVREQMARRQAARASGDAAAAVGFQGRPLVHADDLVLA